MIRPVTTARCRSSSTSLLLGTDRGALWVVNPSPPVSDQNGRNQGARQRGDRADTFHPAHRADDGFGADAVAQTTEIGHEPV